MTTNEQFTKLTDLIHSNDGNGRNDVDGNKNVHDFGVMSCAASTTMHFVMFRRARKNEKKPRKRKLSASRAQ